MGKQYLVEYLECYLLIFKKKLPNNSNSIYVNVIGVHAFLGRPL